MFFKNLKNKILIILLTLFMIPCQVLGYSEYIIAGGENIGIQLNATGVMVVGTYTIDDSHHRKDIELQNGDKIISINDTNISSIPEMVNIIENSSNKDMVRITYLRGSKTLSTNLKLVKDENNIYKTGLYVKDSISGVGTLTFIDPKTKLYGALGHEIVEKTTGQKIEIKDGKIYDSTVTSITKSNGGIPGEKNARYDTTKIYGNVLENTSNGVFGTYNREINETKLYKVATVDDIKLGEATIKTVLDGKEVLEYKIQILKINQNEKSNKNILFEITDEALLNKAGGIVQGMSGSPILQNGNIVGAVTHVVVDNPTKGYGVFITSMLEEAEN